MQTKKIDRNLKLSLLGKKNYSFYPSDNFGYCYVQFQLFRFECDIKRYQILVEAIDWWNSIDATERHNHWKKYETENNQSSWSMDSLTSLMNKDFPNGLLVLYNFIVLRLGY
jgi:hypothetical protein